MPPCRLLIFLTLGICTALGLPAESNLPALEYQHLELEQDGQTAKLDLCLFDPSAIKLRVMDNCNHLGLPRTQKLAYAMSKGTYVAGVNGGFYKVSAYTPYGQQISNGVRTEAFIPDNWMKGVILVKDDQLSLIHRDDFEDSESITQLLQSGPWLIYDGKIPGEGLGKDRYHTRTFIAYGRDDRWLIGICDTATLLGLAEILQSDAVREHIDIERALNLDGGPSSGFWMRKPGGGIVNIPEISTVRNYIGLYR